MVAHGVQHDRSVATTQDDPENPTVITWTFPDGLDEHITPRLARHKQPTTRLPEGGIANWTGHGTTRRVDSISEWIDVLMVGRPTKSPRWIELTEPGNHWHPADGDPPAGWRNPPR